MSSDIGSRLRAAMAQGYAAYSRVRCESDVTTDVELRQKSPELRQLRQLRVVEPCLGSFVSSNGSPFFSENGIYDVTHVTGVTRGETRRNQRFWLRVEDPFAPISPTSYSVAFAKLQSSRPNNISADFWKIAVGDAKRFLGKFEDKASSLGWSAEDIFQAPSSANLMGLVWFIQGDEMIGIDGTKAFFVSGRIFDRSNINPFLWTKRKIENLEKSLVQIGLFEETEANKLAQIFTVEKHKDYEGLRWRKIQAGATQFALDWTPKARSLDWEMRDMFGLHTEAPASRYDCMGLAWLLGDEWRVKSLDARGANIENVRGAILRYRRKFTTTCPD